MQANILSEIIADEQQWLAAQKNRLPLADFEQLIAPSKRNFYQALSSNQTAYILECKKASPSKGMLRADFRLEDIVAAYNPYAAAISVLVNEKYFHGSFSNLTLVSQLTDKPVLCKGFIIDDYQIKLARFKQADAVLLMLSVLTDQQYSQLAATAQQLNMGVLTEVSNHQELQRAIKLNARVIGINNRNLRDLSIDLNKTIELAPQVPPGRIIISESGIGNFSALQRLRGYVNGFLIGSSLMQEDNLPWALKKLIYGANKVCGLTSTAAAHWSAEAGAAYGGLIFADDSPRCVNLPQAEKIIAAATNSLKFVAVFRRPQLAQVSSIAKQLSPTAVQLHGTFTQEQITQLRARLPGGCQIWLALSVADSCPPTNWQHVDNYVFDNALGGSGQTFNWQTLAKAATETVDLSRVILAGGLAAHNCRRALDLGCAGLDFNSGVEISPGVKDQQLIREVFAIIRNL